jgi:hypothetical protein
MASEKFSALEQIVEEQKKTYGQWAQQYFVGRQHLLSLQE